ncbi:MAG: hypothetical protein ABI571_08375 [Actinomycetota bacterium]
MLNKLRDDRRLVLSGLSALREYSVDLIAGEQVEGYARASDRDRLIEEFQLVEGDKANVHLRVVEDESWPFDSSYQFVPELVVAIDLLESADPRVHRAGDELLRKTTGAQQDD